jgi:DNA-binding transcriptional LysR family regulator
MTLHQLKIFDCVVHHRNITKASETLHISQPTVSQQLKLLEEEFGTKFFVRLSQGVELTARGRNFMDAVRPILAQAENVEKKFKSRQRVKNRDQLVIGGSHNVSVNVLPKLLMAFRERHPKVQFILETNNSPVIEKRLSDSELQIALITNPSYRTEIVYEPYDEMEVVAFCLPTNPLAGKKLTLKELVQCPLVVRSEGRIERALINLGYSTNIVMRCEASETVKAAVRMGMGIGILYRDAIANRVAKGNLKLINVPELREMGTKSFIVYDKRKPLEPMPAEFLEVVRQKQNLHIRISRLPTSARAPIRL